MYILRAVGYRHRPRTDQVVTVLTKPNSGRSRDRLRRDWLRIEKWRSRSGWRTVRGRRRRRRDRPRERIDDRSEQAEISQHVHGPDKDGSSRRDSGRNEEGRAADRREWTSRRKAVLVIRCARNRLERDASSRAKMQTDRRGRELGVDRHRERRGKPRVAGEVRL